MAYFPLTPEDIYGPRYDGKSVQQLITGDDITEKCINFALSNSELIVAGDDRDVHGNTLLHHAIERGDLKLFKILFETVYRGDACCLEISNNDGNTAFHLFGVHKSVSIVKYLNEYFGRPEIKHVRDECTTAVCQLLYSLYPFRQLFLRNSCKNNVFHCAAVSDENIGIIDLMRKIEKRDITLRFLDCNNVGETAALSAFRARQYVMADKMFSIVSINEHEQIMHIRQQQNTQTDGFRMRIMPARMITTMLTHSFAGAVATNCSLEALNYLYTRGYDFSGVSPGDTKMDEVIRIVEMGLRDRELLQTIIMLSVRLPSFHDFRDLFKDRVDYYVRKKRLPNGKFLVPSLRTFCQRTIRENELDVSQVPKALLLDRDDVGKELYCKNQSLLYSAENSINANLKDRKRKREQESSEIIKKQR